MYDIFVKLKTHIDNLIQEFVVPNWSALLWSTSLEDLVKWAQFYYLKFIWGQN